MSVSQNAAILSRRSITKKKEKKNRNQRTKCTINDCNKKIVLSLFCTNAKTCSWNNKNVNMIEGKVPPPFGLITPDALSPCLFTLLQQLGQWGVNKASGPSTARVITSARELRSLSGPCQTVLCATVQMKTGGLGKFWKAQPRLKQLRGWCKRAPYRPGCTAQL